MSWRSSRTSAKSFSELDFNKTKNHSADHPDRKSLYHFISKAEGKLALRPFQVDQRSVMKTWIDAINNPMESIISWVWGRRDKEDIGQEKGQTLRTGSWGIRFLPSNDDSCLTPPMANCNRFFWLEAQISLLCWAASRCCKTFRLYICVLVQPTCCLHTLNLI